MTAWNISELAINFTTPGAAPPEVITTNTLLAVCRQMDNQAYMAAVGGLVLSIVAIVYFGRFRRKLLEKKENENVVAFADKFLLTVISMCFVIIVVRLVRAG